MNTSSDTTAQRAQIFANTEVELTNKGYTIAEKDDKRPWGGFFRVVDTDAPQFLADNFEDVTLPDITLSATLSPKILIVEPDKKLSWQVHGRRNEFWRVKQGPIGAYLSETDEKPKEPKIYQAGETIDIGTSVRHRLVGLPNNWGIVAEIWIHTDPTNPSDESDILRIEDDFGR